MKFESSLYGTFEVTEPLLLDLLQSRPVQRMKKVQQFGVPPQFYCRQFPPFTRYQHSVGVMLLLRRLGASTEVQAAGLLHDTSHAAFSHVFDWVVGLKESEDFQDRNHAQILLESEVPRILKRHHASIERVVNFDRYSLLEKPVPDLCADRFDSAIREIESWAGTRDMAKWCVDSLTVRAGRMVFDSIEPAEAFGRCYLKIQSEHWGGPENLVRWHLFSTLLKTALDEKVLTLKDFAKDDEALMDELERSDSEKVHALMKKLSGDVRFEAAEKNAQLSLGKKFRHVDPEYLHNGRVFRLSQTSDDFKALLEKHRALNEKGVSVNILA